MEETLPGLQTATLSLYPHRAKSKREPALLRALIPPWGPILMTSSKPHHLPKIPSLKLGVSVPIYKTQGKVYDR